MPLLSPDDCLCNELLPATTTTTTPNDNFNSDLYIDNNKVFSDRCSAVQTSANMAPKKKMRRSVKNQMSDDKDDRKKTVHFGDVDVIDGVVVKEETDDFPSVDFFVFSENTKQQQCDSEIDAEEEPIEATTDTTSDDLQQLYSEYRFEVEQLVRSSVEMGNEKRILTLERLVDDLLEQNQTLVTSLAEIKEESARRVVAMHQRLQSSAARTEEVMLSLASHELLLKKFVQEHCCSCCACDLRLMQFRLCHREQCGDDEPHLQPLDEDEEEAYQRLTIGRCRTVYQHRQWNSILHNTSSWFDNCGRSTTTTRKRLLPADDTCAHNLPSQLRFTSFVDQIDDRLEALEAENEEVKHENALLRELNSLLSGRNGPPLTISSYGHCVDNNRLPSLYQIENVSGSGSSVASSTSSASSLSYTNRNVCAKNKKLDHLSPHLHHQQDHHPQLPTLLHDDNESEIEETTALSEHLITFLSECSQRNGLTAEDSFGNYLHDSLDLRDRLFGGSLSLSNSSGSDHGGSRSESLNSSHGGRTDNDSGCSTDLIPSQTDMNSLMTHTSFDGEEEVEDLLRSVIAETSASNQGKKITKEQGNTTDQSLNSNPSTAERLVPKLYSKLLYYLVQRNMLLRQFQQENRARQKCKEELSTLADCVAAGLKDIELNTKVIKQIQLQSDTSLF